MNINKLHQEFVEYGAIAREWQRKCALLLPEIVKYQVWRKKGFTCIYHYAAKLAGMSRLQVDDALRILRKIEDKPALMEVARLRGVNAVRPVATIATVETAGYWASQARKMNKNELETFVREVRHSEAETPSEAGTMNAAVNMEEIILKLRPTVALKLRQFMKGDVNELMEKFMQLYEQDLNAQKPEVKQGGSRSIPAKIVRYIYKRCGGKCEFPNCNKAFADLHHIDRYKLVKKHDPDRIVALCKAHHDLAHRGLVQNEDGNFTKWKIRNNPDYNNLNWYVDQEVQFYRRA